MHSRPCLQPSCRPRAMKKPQQHQWSSGRILLCLGYGLAAPRLCLGHPVWALSLSLSLFFLPLSVCLFLAWQYFCWELISCHLLGGWVMDCSRAQYILHGMWTAHPYLAGSLQGSHGVSCGTLAVNDLGSGSGWQQSKQNWALPAVVGQ